MGRWIFYDPVLATSYSFSANPNSDQESYTKTETYEAVLVPGGAPLIYEGRDQPTSITLSGTFLSEAQQQALLSWYQKRYQLLLTDDRGYQRYVYPYSYQVTRKPSALYQWRGDWQMQLYLMSPATFP
jgi:hypothetical protein